MTGKKNSEGKKREGQEKISYWTDHAAWKKVKHFN